MILPLNGMSRWMTAVILFFGILLKPSICESSGTCEACRQKNILLVNAGNSGGEFPFPSEVVYRSVGGLKLCFNVKRTNEQAGCCRTEDFNCSFEVNSIQNEYSLTLDNETLLKQDIVLMTQPDQPYDECMPSKFYNKTSGFLLNLHRCLNKGVQNIRLSHDNICGNSDACKEKSSLTICAKKDCHAVWICTSSGSTSSSTGRPCPCPCPWCPHPSSPPPPTSSSSTASPPPTSSSSTASPPHTSSSSTVSSSSSPSISITIPPPVNNGSSLENAANIMNNIAALVEKLGDSTSAHISLGDIKGVITKLAKKEQGSITVGVTTGKDVKILEKNSYPETGLSKLVRIPKEASGMAVKKNGTFAAVVVFPGVRQDDPSSTFLNNEMIGIEMGAIISNLSETIDIQYNVDKNGSIASCMSWDGKGKQANWTTDGCETNENNDSITCQCSHLTFFAILMSPVPQNISSSDFKALTYITSIGCGMSMFFLAVALFMHCLIRKGKASDGTKILINLFIAMFTLNLSFLINKHIANLGIFAACVAMAATMHFTLLATFTWFFMEAIHLYFNIWTLPTEIKHYLIKIYVVGWGAPAVVMIGLLASRNYGYVAIHTDDGSSSKMCWIPDAAVHQGVNIGYYAIVFLFTFTVFITTVHQIVILKPKDQKAQNVGSSKRNSFSIIGLVLLLGITWAFAFFSHGPLLIPSYYIFTILNSLQGFFLFIYYYNSSKTATGDRNTTASSSSSTATSNTVVMSPYQ